MPSRETTPIRCQCHCWWRGGNLAARAAPHPPCTDSPAHFADNRACTSDAPILRCPQYRPAYATPFKGSLFFTAFGPKGSELYKTDGTAQGTVLVKDTDPSYTRNRAHTGTDGTIPSGGAPRHLTVVRDPQTKQETLFFAANIDCRSSAFLYAWSEIESTRPEHIGDNLGGTQPAHGWRGDTVVETWIAGGTPWNAAMQDVLLPSLAPCTADSQCLSGVCRWTSSSDQVGTCDRGPYDQSPLPLDTGNQKAPLVRLPLYNPDIGSAASDNGCQMFNIVGSRESTKSGDLPSTSATWRHPHLFGVTCPANVSNANWFSFTEASRSKPGEDATFAVSQSGRTVTVKRTDKDAGWSGTLSFLCCKGE